MRKEIVPTVKAAITWLHLWDFKTLDYFIRVLMDWVNDLFTGEVTEGEFVDRLADLIDQQLTRAFNEGMRANGLDPLLDMTEEYQQALQEIIANEYQYVDAFAHDVATQNGSLAQFQNRAQMWANRYNDVVNQAKLLTADGADRYEWVMGPTEKHCSTCGALDGLVATAKEWEISGFKPQGDMLECGGWQCKCSLQPTDRRRSPKVLDTLLNIGTKI